MVDVNNDSAAAADEATTRRQVTDAVQLFFDARLRDRRRAAATADDDDVVDAPPPPVIVAMQRLAREAMAREGERITSMANDMSRAGDDGDVTSAFTAVARELFVDGVRSWHQVVTLATFAAEAAAAASADDDGAYAQAVRRWLGECVSQDAVVAFVRDNGGLVSIRRNSFMKKLTNS